MAFKVESFVQTPCSSTGCFLMPSHVPASPQPPAGSVDSTPLPPGGTVLDAAVRSASADEVVVLLFVDQVITKATMAGPGVDNPVTS